MKVQVCQLKPGLEYRLLMYEGQGPDTYLTMVLERWWVSRDQIMVVGRTGPNDDHISFSITHTLDQIKKICNPGEGHWHQSFSSDKTWDWDLDADLPWVVRDLIVSERRVGQFHRYNLLGWNYRGDRRAVRKELNRRRMTLRESKLLHDYLRSMAGRSRDSTQDYPGLLKQLGSLADVGGMKVTLTTRELEHINAKGFEHG